MLVSKAIRKMRIRLVSTEINLMPEWVIQAKQHRLLVTLMLIVQILVFLALLLVMAVFISSERDTLSRTEEISLRLQYFDPAWEQVAFDATTARANDTQLEDFFSSVDASRAFDSAWLATVIETAPPDVVLIRMTHSHSQILITAKATDIAFSEIHRRKLIATGTFHEVRIGAIRGIDNGFYSYDLHIEV